MWLTSSTTVSVSCWLSHVRETSDLSILRVSHGMSLLGGTGISHFRNLSSSSAPSMRRYLFLPVIVSVIELREAFSIHSVSFPWITVPRVPGRWRQLLTSIMAPLWIGQCSTPLPSHLLPLIIVQGMIDLTRISRKSKNQKIFNNWKITKISISKISNKNFCIWR